RRWSVGVPARCWSRRPGRVTLRDGLPPWPGTDTMPGELGLSSRSTARAWLAGALLAAAVVAACGGRRADGAVPQPPREAAAAAALAPAAPLPDSTFARLIAELSEPGGYFDTDNLISNEASYLHVAQDLRELRGRGGAYIGVGPDQNFS